MNKFIWGIVYNIFHDEYPTDQEFFQQVDKDIASMKEANIDHILIFPVSQWDAEKKELKWERTDYLIKKIEQYNLHFIPLLLKEEQCSHYFPIWKFKEIDGFWETHNRMNKSKNNSENVDFANPKVLPLLESYFKEVVERYGKSNALSFYNIWNEPHYSSEADHVIDKFREWLKQKYKSLENLRLVWGKDFTHWSEVSPFLSDNWNSTMPQIDWTMFRNELNGKLLGELKTILKKYDSSHEINANPVGTPWADFKNFGSYSVDNWVFSKDNDFNGVSYYPDGWEKEHNLESYPPWLHNLSFNTIRSSSLPKNYILTEMYTNAQNGLALNGYLDKQSIMNIAWTALSNDCKGIIFWKWEPFRRGRQSLGRGLVGLNGKLASRGEGVKEIGRILKNYGSILYKARLNQSKVAIMMDMVGLLKTLEQPKQDLTERFMYESNAGIFQALYEENITSDLLRIDRGIDLNELKKYKILFLPFQIVIRKDFSGLLKEYVNQGGWVVADARTGVLDEFDLAYRKTPGSGLDELFGAEVTDWSGNNGYYSVIMVKSNKNVSYTFEGKYYKEQLELKRNVKILGTFTDDNFPAIIENNYGKGKAILSSVPLGGSYFNNFKNPVNKVIIDLVYQAGALPDAIFKSNEKFNLDLKIHSSGNAKVVYAINFESVKKEGTIEINSTDFVPKEAINISTGQQISFIIKGKIIVIPVKINKSETLVILLNK